MALLQVHQAKAFLKQLHEGGADPAGLQELRTATDLALRATKVTARALGQTMSTLVVQERHLWLTLADMRESDKHRFLDSPILPGRPIRRSGWRASPNSSLPHSSRRRRFDTSCPGGPLLSPPHRRLQPLRLLVAERALLRPPPPLQLGLSSSLTTATAWSWPQESGAARLCPCQNLRSARPSGGPETGDPESLDPALQEVVTRTTPSPGGGPGGESFVPFLFCSATGSPASGTQNLKKRAVSFFSGSQEGEDGSARDPVSHTPVPLSFRL